jgi:hypothetical protein
MMLARKAKTQAQAFAKITIRNPLIKKATHGIRSGWLFDGSLMIFASPESLHHAADVTTLKFIVLPLRKKTDGKPAFFTRFS